MGEMGGRESKELGKRVIATHGGANPPGPLPGFIKHNKIKVVPWSNLAAELQKK